MKQFLTYEKMEKICSEINDKHIPEDHRFMKAIDDLLERYDGVQSETLIRQAFHRMLSVLDKEIKIIEGKVQLQSSCTVGCVHCCYFPVIITKLEAKLIVDYILQQPADKKAQVLSHLKNFYETHGSQLEEACAIDIQTTPNYKELYISKQVPCPFLDTHSNTCFAHEVRPISCRTYVNYCAPNVCEDDYLPKEVFSYEFLYDYYMYALVTVIQQAVFDGDNLSISFPNDVYELGYLPILVAELLQDELWSETVEHARS